MEVSHFHVCAHGGVETLEDDEDDE
jgi:hypothetical protein